MALIRDLRYAVRMLGRSPGYALTCVAVLALGIGANAAIFSVIHSVILKALPYPHAARLVFLWERLPHLTNPLSGRIQVARKNYLEWKRQNTVFSDMAAFRDWSVSETGTDHPRHVFHRASPPPTCSRCSGCRRAWAACSLPARS